MDIQKEESKEFKFSTEKVEKSIGIGVLIFFFLTLNTYNNAAINIGIFSFTAVVFIYYFVWYRKKPPYVVIKGNEVIISPFPFFKPISIKGDSIQKVKTEDNGLVLSYMDNNEAKRIKLYSIVLDPKDQKNIKKLVNAMIKKD
jgi:hypothetical protein